MAADKAREDAERYGRKFVDGTMTWNELISFLDWIVQNFGVRFVLDALPSTIKERVADLYASREVVRGEIGISSNGPFVIADEFVDAVLAYQADLHGKK